MKRLAILALFLALPVIVSAQHRPPPHPCPCNLLCEPCLSGARVILPSGATFYCNGGVWIVVDPIAKGK